MNDVFKIGEIVEYHPSEWMQRETKSKPIEIVEVVGFTDDGALLYENDKFSGTIGFKNLNQFIKKITKDNQ